MKLRPKRLKWWISEASSVQHQFGPVFKKVSVFQPGSYVFLSMNLYSLCNYPECTEIMKTLFRTHAATRTVISNMCLVTLLGGNHLQCIQIIWYSSLIDWYIQKELVIAALVLSSGKIEVFKLENSMEQCDCGSSQGHIFICGYFFIDHRISPTSLIL